jgi:hypothetical protein
VPRRRGAMQPRERQRRQKPGESDGDGGGTVAGPSARERASLGDVLALVLCSASASGWAADQRLPPAQLHYQGLVAAMQAKRVLRSVCHGARAAVDALVDTLALWALQGEEAEAWLRFTMRADTIRHLRLRDDWGMYPEGGIMDRWERVEGRAAVKAWGQRAVCTDNPHPIPNLPCLRCAPHRTSKPHARDLQERQFTEVHVCACSRLCVTGRMRCMRFAPCQGWGHSKRWHRTSARVAHHQRCPRRFLACREGAGEGVWTVSVRDRVEAGGGVGGPELYAAMASRFPNLQVSLEQTRVVAAYVSDGTG